MKKLIVALIVILLIGIGIFLNRVDSGGEMELFDMDAHPGLEWMRVTKLDEEVKVHTGQWMTLEDVSDLAEKKEDFSGDDLWDYQYYAIMSDKYYRIYEIADYDMLFELHVSWSLDEYEENYRPDNYYYIRDMEVSEALLIAKDGLDTQVDIRTGDVESYIKEHQNNPGYKKFGFLYLPVEVEGTQETTEKISHLIEDSETFVVSHPEELVAIKIDSGDELYAFTDEMQEELKYTDKAIGENMYYQMALMTNTRVPEPQFLLYISEGYQTHDYYVTNMEKHGKEDLYITISKTPRKKNEGTMDGCLIGLRILKDSDEPSTIKEVSTIHIEMIEP